MGYKRALELFHSLHSDLAMLIFAPKDGNDETALEVDTTEVVCRKVTEDDFDPLDYMNKLQSVVGEGGLQEQLLNSHSKVFDSLYNLLKHDVEGGSFQEEEKTREIIVMSIHGGRFQKHEDVYHEINSTPFVLGSTDEQITQDERVKVTVICRALENAKEHLNEIQTLLSKHIQL